MDFFSVKELVTQTGHDVGEWPLVFLKETIDNALDACEEHDIAPVIEITADARGITVQDNGPGLPENTLEAAKDMDVRASSREAYVAPDRGAQGNALKTLLPMPALVDPDAGKLIVVAHGKRHELHCHAHPVRQTVEIDDDFSTAETSGTLLGMQWDMRQDSDGDILWPFGDVTVVSQSRKSPVAGRFQAFVQGFALFNPHATFRLNWFGTETAWAATNEAWENWKPNRPTSPHWYEQRHFERLIGAYITHDRARGEDRLVSKFLAEFDGLTGSQKRSLVLTETDLHRCGLSVFDIGGDLDKPRIAKLLASMQRHTRPVKSKSLGVIGEDHMRTRLLQMGIVPESFRYAKFVAKDGLPTVMEAAFGWKGEGSKGLRTIHAGANWSAAIKNPFRSFGGTGQGMEAYLSELRVGRSEPVVIVLHLAHPRIEYTDRGKTELIITHQEQ